MRLELLGLIVVLGSCGGGADCPQGFLRDNDGNCIEQGGGDGDADADADSDSDADADGDVIYDCGCDASFEDYYDYFQDSWSDNYCIDPDYAQLVTDDAANECYLYWANLGYYNISCYCTCTPTGQGC